MLCASRESKLSMRVGQEDSDYEPDAAKADDAADADDGTHKKGSKRKKGGARGLRMLITCLTFDGRSIVYGHHIYRRTFRGHNVGSNFALQPGFSLCITGKHALITS